MKRLRGWLSKIVLILPVILIAAGISLVSQSCPPRFKTDASTQILCYVDSTDDDAYIYKQSASSWDAAHDATSGTIQSGDWTFIQIGISNNYSGSGVWRSWRGFHVFDTSGIPDGAVITAASFHFNVDEVQDTVTNYQKVFLVGGGLTYPHEPIEAGDFDITQYYNYYGASKFIDNGVPANSLVVGDWNTITLNALGIANINLVGNTPLCTMVTWDWQDDSPANGQRAYVDYGSADSIDPPYLEVWYSTLPTVTSQAATSVDFSTATANGNITDTGYDNNDDRGCVYATSSHGDPAGVPPESSVYTYHTHDPGSWGTGAFPAALSSLSEDQVYYYRMWTHNPVTGYDYSNTEQSFHTLQIPLITTSAATSVMNTTARLPGNVTDAGWPASDTVVVYWGDNDGVTTPGNWDYSGAPTSPAQPQGVAAFYKDISGLTPGGTYYFRAAATNTSGTTWAAATRTFSTTNDPPIVVSSAATSVTNVSAVLNGSISSCGGDPTCANYGFVWATTTHADPGNTDPSATAYSDYWKAGSGRGVGNFQRTITVVPRTVYYFRSCAQNSSGWAYSPNPEKSFTTCDHPDVTTYTPSSVTGTSANFRGTLDSIWFSNTTVWGFAFATDAYYVGHGSTYDQDTHVHGVLAPGWMTIPVLTLTLGTKYHYRAYATNAYGTGYGSDTHFGTIPENPTGLTAGAMSYTTVDLTWVEGAHAAKTMIRYETASTTVDFPTGPDQGTEAYFNSDEACTVDSLTPGETYYFAAWSWIDGSDVWSSGYSTVVVTLSVPPPVSLKAVPDDATTVNLWWIVPIGMRSVPTVTTILYGCVGTYPADPPNPPNPSDILIYTEITGDAGVKDYTWETATAGTPYFFSVWFYDSFTDNYTSAVSALCTTPAGFDDPSMPGGGSFNPPTDAAMTGVPIHSVVEHLADVAGMDHGFYWGLMALLVGIIATMGAIIATKSGLMGTGVGGLILAVANTQDIVAVWVTIAFVFLGIVLSWVASHVYA